MDKALEYFQENGVICKKVEDDREDYGDFIAVFGYGKLTREQIVEHIKANNLLCMFFEGQSEKMSGKRECPADECRGKR